MIEEITKLECRINGYIQALWAVHYNVNNIILWVNPKTKRLLRGGSCPIPKYNFKSPYHEDYRDIFVSDFGSFEVRDCEEIPLYEFIILPEEYKLTYTKIPKWVKE